MESLAFFVVPERRERGREQGAGRSPPLPSPSTSGRRPRIFHVLPSTATYPSLLLPKGCSRWILAEKRCHVAAQRKRRRPTGGAQSGRAAQPTARPTLFQRRRWNSLVRAEAAALRRHFLTQPRLPLHISPSPHNKDSRSWQSANQAQQHGVGSSALSTMASTHYGAAQQHQRRIRISGGAAGCRHVSRPSVLVLYPALWLCLLQTLATSLKDQPADPVEAHRRLLFKRFQRKSVLSRFLQHWRFLLTRPKVSILRCRLSSLRPITFQRSVDSSTESGPSFISGFCSTSVGRRTPLVFPLPFVHRVQAGMNRRKPRFLWRHRSGRSKVRPVALRSTKWESLTMRFAILQSVLPCYTFFTHDQK